MIRSPLAQALGQVRRTLGGTADEPTDRQLLQRFAATKEDAAFAALVRRHGAMVLGVCRRVLGNHADADDAFQAAFLILARRAGSVGWRQSVGNWLYTVAYRVASKQRLCRARRCRHEHQAGLQRTCVTNESPSVQELQTVIDQELACLPEKFRMPVLLCCLQDQTVDEAARQLGWSFATVKGRLQRGREQLRDRLRRRGITLSVGVLASVLTQGVARAVPPGLLNATVDAATTGTMAPPVAALVKGAMQMLFYKKLKLFFAVLAAVSVLGVGGALATYWPGQSGQGAAAAPVGNQPPDEKKAVLNEPVIVTNKDDGKTVSVEVGATIEVRLAGTVKNTGWEGGLVKGEALVHVNGQRGQPGQPPSPPGLQPLPFGSEFLPDPNPTDRAIGTYIFVFKAVKEGRAGLHMDYITPGGPGVTARLRSARLATFSMTVDVTAAKAKAAQKSPLTDAEMAALAKETAQKGKFQELQEIRSKNPHLGGTWLLEQPLKQHRFWCIVHAYTTAAPVRSYIAIGRNGDTIFPFKSEDFAKLLKAEDRSKWTDAQYLQAAALYIHLTATSHQDGWKIVNAPAEFLAIKFNMFPEIEKKREDAAKSIAKASVVRDMDTVRVRLWAWQLIGGALREWNLTFTPTDLKAASKELGRFGGGGYD